MDEQAPRSSSNRALRAGGDTVRRTLRDGRSIVIRGIRPDDKSLLLDGLHRLSDESAYFRFFRPKHELSEQELAYFTEVDFERHVALVAVLGERPVGVARYVVAQSRPPVTAEMAFTVDDAYHGLGIATAMLHELVRIARERGVDELRAMVLPDNRKMLDVFAHAGLPHTAELAEGTVEVRFPLAPDGALSRRAGRGARPGTSNS